MAVTSLWRVKGYIGKVLLYAENPDKTTSPETIPSPAGVNRDTLEDVIAYAGREEATNQRQLVTGINCNAGTARSEMMAVKKRFRKEDCSYSVCTGLCVWHIVFSALWPICWPVPGTLETKGVTCCLT